MAVSERCALVLWGMHCDEAAAAIFVTTLRAAGLRVWLVGISGGRIAGGHGMRIQPDLTPSQALPLADQACCVVIPCVALLLLRFLNDPTVEALLHRATAAQATVIISTAPAPNPPAYLAQAMTYPPTATLYPFATALAATLVQDAPS